MADINYFTCTLGEAAKLDLTKTQFENISAFLDYQAQHVPNSPAAGFFVPKTDGAPWATRIYNFGQLRDISLNLASRLEKRPDIAKSRTVALLCPSNNEFMFLWLALIRLDIAVLLLAPQCQPDAILHLCKECKVEVLLYHGTYEQLAKQTLALAKDKKGGSAQNLSAIAVSGILSEDIENNALQNGTIEHSKDAIKQRESEARLHDIAYIHHTSGTSSGLPKPIHQAHNAAVGALPKISRGQGESKATFTTTPLYHGGIADCFRSWTSGAMIWLFPGKDVPITAANVVKALEAATDTARHQDFPHTTYFSCVPYVLQLLEDDPNGLKWLQRMDIVGVGGASLPDEVGDRIVKASVNLISRYGSSECGFLMSSHRDYQKDQAWQYLRCNVGSEYLRFEPRDDGLSELVVSPSWPHRAKTNRDDGSFATADLFEPHSSIPDAWRYHSRADSQLTLITGKKFDPAPLEAVLADSKSISDAFIFGNGRPYPGVLIFKAEDCKDCANNVIVDSVWDALQALNAKSQGHARIARDMVKLMPWQSQPLEKSSKGTLIRSKIEARFAAEVGSAYAEKDAESVEVKDDEIEHRVLEIVKQSLGKSEKLNVDTDLFAYGVDSIAAMRIRGRLQALVSGSKTLPITVVENCGTISAISKLILDLRNGTTSDSADELQLMQELVEEYSKFVDAHSDPQTDGAAPANESRQTIILTGATGALGTHVLDLCAKNSRVKKVICLIRGEDEHAARGRLEKALEGRKLSLPKESEVEVEIVPAKLGESALGLDEVMYTRLAEEATVVLHLAWEVNFRMNLRSFRSTSIAGTMNLINLALASPRPKPPRFAFCSSVASVMSCHGMIREEPSDNPSDASPLGYSRSKWVAEQICRIATSKTRLQGRMSIMRVGQLAGDTETGIWNEKEAWPMMLSTVKLVKSLPKIEDEPLNWLPVNIAAQAFVEAAVERITDVSDEVEVIHVLNQRQETTWMDLLAWLKKQIEFEIVSPETWIEKLEESQSQGKEHPSFRLIGLWKENLINKEHKAESNEASEDAPHLETIRSVRAAPVLADIAPVDEEYFKKLWKWMDDTV